MQASIFMHSGPYALTLLIITLGGKTISPQQTEEAGEHLSDLCTD